MRLFDKNVFFFISVLLCGNCAFSQFPDTDYLFVNIKESNTQRAISTITQDHRGFIWMGTNGVGLTKFNGTDYTYYKHRWDDASTLSSSLIYTSFIDSANRLWIGTGAGLNRYDRDQNKFIRIPLATENDQNKAYQVTAIIEDEFGKLVIGTNQYGAYYLDPENDAVGQIKMTIPFETYNLLINSIAKDLSGTIYVGTNRGLLEYDREHNTFNQKRVQTSNGSVIVSEHIQSLLVDDAGSLWLGTFSDGLFKLDSNNGREPFKKYAVTDKRVLCFVQLPNGRLLFGTENDGLFLIDKEGRVLKNYRYDKFNKNSIKSNSVWSLFVDAQERIWVGYYNNGVGVYDQFYDKFKDIESLPNVPNSLQTGSVTAIVKNTDGTFWIGMDGGGVDVVDVKKQEFVHLVDEKNNIATGLTGHDVQTVFLDSRGNFWVGTWNSGIFFLQKNETVFKNFNIASTKGAIASNRILSFAEDSKGTVWIGTFLNGLHSYSPRTNEFTFHNSESFNSQGIHYTDIRKVLVDGEDHIWLGTTRGLFKVIPEADGTYQVISLNQQMNDVKGKESDVYTVLALMEDASGSIWIGLDGDGLCKYDTKAKTFKWYTEIDGVDQETVSTIVETENGLWFGGNKGLSHLNLKTESLTNYTREDGLLTNDFNNNAVLKGDDGMLYFGNFRGINYFDPTNILVNKNPPSLYFSDLKLFNESVVPGSNDAPLQKVLSETDALVLNHKQSVFTIEFMGINYTRSEENQYAYYLEGFEENWNYVADNRSATYTNLPKGNYVFKVKAANNDGVWNEEAISLKIEILPPWWATNWAILGYVLFLGFLAFMTFRIVNERIQEKRLIKFEREKRKQEEILHEKKLQFFTNISHEFRTPLTLILNPLEDILDNSLLQLPESVQEKHQIIHKNTSRLSRLIDELMDFRKLKMDKMSVTASEINAVSFVKEVSGHFEEEASEKNIILSNEADSTSLKIWADPGMLEKIVFNILSNAFKVTPENGLITVGVNRTAEPKLLPLVNETTPVAAMEIGIQDTGPGIKKEEVDRIFERFYLVKEMNSQYYGGTGIGLEVVKSFVDLHKGKIEVESKVNEGTHFRIILPLGKEHFQNNELFLTDTVPQEKQEAVEIEKEVVDFTSPDYKTAVIPKKDKKKLLVIEDNKELRTYLKGELQSEYSIVEAPNGKEGLAIANERIPDIVLTDVIMPEMDGFEFCTQMRANIKTSHIPILMLTAKAMTDDWAKGIDSGADVYLSKPFKMKVLQSHLKQLISSRQILFDRYFNQTSNLHLPEKTSSLDKSFITKVLNYIHENIDDTNLNVEHLAEDLFLSRSQLYRKIKALTGHTANEFLRKIRLEKAKQMIVNGNDSISEVSFKVGFSSPSYFTKCFKSHFGVLPTEIKNE